MKKISLIFLICLFVTGGVVGSALAISFDEVDLFNENPLIDGVQFSAGVDSGVDTAFTADFENPGNPYLANGFLGSLNLITGAAQGFSFASVTLDLAGENILPGGTLFTLDALSSGSIVATQTMAIPYLDTAYHLLSLSFATGFDSFVLSDTSGVFFHIDNVEYTRYTGGGGQPVPEPGTMLLMAAGLAGLGAVRRRFKS